ncbi:MAG: response regulator, partial [Bacteroidota bacterium]
MTCLALDDEPLALRVLENHLRRCPDLQPLGFFTDPNAAQKTLARNSVELLFLDIEMPDTSGISFLRQLVPRPLVIFTTAYRRYAVEGFELAAVDYLVKPFDFARLRRAVDRANLRLSAEQTLLPEQFITVNSAYEVIKIPLDDLYVAEVYGDYLKIYLTGREKPILTLMSLKKLS